MDCTVTLNPIVWVIAGLLGLFGIYQRIARKTTAYDTLPWVGLSKGPLSQLRAFFSLADAREQLSRAYKEYSLNGKSFAWQGLLSPPLVVLPPSQIPWLIEQPDHVLNATKFFDDKAFGHALLDNGLLYDALHENVVRTELTRALGLTLKPVADEIEATLRERLGRSEVWQKIDLRSLMTTLYARTSVRAFSGIELARNAELTKEVVTFANLTIATSFLLQPFPEALRPVAGLAILYPSRRCYRRLSKHLLPHVEQRITDFERSAREPACKADAPNDLLQWLITASYASRNTANRDRHRICRRYLGCTNAAIHTTAIMASHILFDLAATPHELNAIALLRDEIEEVRAQQGAHGWTKPALTQLRRLDSAIRESLRLGVLAATTMGRVVVAPTGMALPDGAWAPFGTHLGVHAFGAHFLDGTYPDPTTYDPFRFARPRGHEAAAAAEEPKHADGPTEDGGRPPEPGWQRRGAASAASPEFLTFGYGKHACPGRFFAVAELKLFLVEFLTKYDVQPLPERPPRQWLRDVQAPNTSVKLTVRSRVD